VSDEKFKIYGSTKLYRRKKFNAYAMTREPRFENDVLHVS
jgi:hypothetical protein